MAEPIRVVISDDTGTATVKGGGTSQASANNKSANPQAKGNKKAAVAQSAATMIAMRSINYATSNVGKWTGNSSYQNQINIAKQAIGYGMAFAINPILGAVTVALDGATYIADYAYEQKWNTIKSQQAQARAGGKGGYRR